MYSLKFSSLILKMLGDYRCTIIDWIYHDKNYESMWEFDSRSSCYETDNVTLHQNSTWKVIDRIKLQNFKNKKIISQLQRNKVIVSEICTVYLEIQLTPDILKFRGLTFLFQYKRISIYPVSEI
jgi:hypothetical protein